jgi:hypothetical protein
VAATGPKQTIGESQIKFVLGTILMLATIPLATASDPFSLVYRAGVTCGHLDFEGTSYEAFERKISSNPSAPSTISEWIQLIRKNVQEGLKKMEISETLLRSNTQSLNESDSADVREKLQTAIQYLNGRIARERSSLSSSKCMLDILEG